MGTLIHTHVHIVHMRVFTIGIHRDMYGRERGEGERGGREWRAVGSAGVADASSGPALIVFECRLHLFKGGGGCTDKPLMKVFGQ
jgi:hypothetical protein